MMQRFTFWALILGICSVLFASCQAPPNQSKQSTKPTILNPITNSSYTFQVGDQFQVKVPIHGSVGIWAEYKIADTEIITLEDTKSEPKNPESVKKGMPGGDAATKIWTFKAMKAGKTTLTVRKMFRSSLEQEDVYQITVQ